MFCCGYLCRRYSQSTNQIEPRSHKGKEYCTFAYEDIYVVAKKLIMNLFLGITRLILPWHIVPPLRTVTLEEPYSPTFSRVLNFANLANFQKNREIKKPRIFFRKLSFAKLKTRE